jgi:hypothetical protein
MQLLDSSEAARWCGDRGITFTHDWPHRLAITGGHPLGIHVMVPEPGLQAVFMAHRLVTAGASETPEENFRGALLWLQDWGIWNESMDGTGEALLDGLRGNHPLAADWKAAPAQLYSQEELAGARAAAFVPLMFQWDAYLVPASGDIVYSISHHGLVEFRFRHAADFERELAICKDLGWGVEARET